MSTIERNRKGLVKAINAHVASSYIDRTPMHAMNTLVAAMFNLLGCRPHRDLLGMVIDPRMYVDLTTPERMQETDSINAMCVAYIELVKVSEPFADVLSSLIMEFQGRSGDGLGQFFTPWDLADLTAEIAADHMKRHAKSGQAVHLSDPTGCGAGSLLLAHLRGLYRDNPAAMRTHAVSGVDLDGDMVRACAVQILWGAYLHAIPLERVTLWHCNALTEYHTAHPMVVCAPWSIAQAA